nr:hypothetical protein [Nitrosomonas nitrosa]
MDGMQTTEQVRRYTKDGWLIRPGRDQLPPRDIDISLPVIPLRFAVPIDVLLNIELEPLPAPQPDVMLRVNHPATGAVLQARLSGKVVRKQVKTLRALIQSEERPSGKLLLKGHLTPGGIVEQAGFEYVQKGRHRVDQAA